MFHVRHGLRGICVPFLAGVGMKKIIIIAAAVATLQLASAQSVPFEQDTNTMTVTDIHGNSYAMDSEFGAFFLGFGSMVGFCVIGMSLRMVRHIPAGHRPPTD